ncbi:GNAT family protein [Luteolibacter sp. SL250]|uniref:GNAT family N-acetyltransferase n=1 Tax=Luteolibacter sp. SL250 TaxID=2995170 RepID=UPI00226DBB66|nr:GNAT family protein [Luteolibacter sp. SL250]WAC20809.1 GNAT family protein [Luteolibacter sp. SL250]
MGILTTLPQQIETERLIIRTARPGDGAVFNAAIHASMERLAPWLVWVTPPPTVEESEESCRLAHGRFLRNEDLMALVFRKECGSLVGGSGLHDADWKAGKFEIGYWGHAAFSGCGYITEAVRALADHALEKLGANRVFLTTDDRNTASWKVAERAGFQLEGMLRNERLNPAGHLRDTRVYARVA